MYDYDIVVIGGGPGGLTAAIEAKNNGADSILILEREDYLGGILNQCIHNDYCFNDCVNKLTGPEYVQILVDKIEERNIEYKLNTMVLEISNDKIITAVNDIEGIINIKAKAIVLALGCREKPVGDTNIIASRCAGIFTAGLIQKFVNIQGVLPGKEIVISGSTDIGLIVARRMTIEGAQVKGIIEHLSYPRALKKNVIQCLENFNIPLKLNHTVIDIDGKERLKGVTIAAVDENLKIIEGTEEYIPCDTLIQCVELVPETELIKKLGIEVCKLYGGPLVNESYQTKIDGIFVCGNLLYIHNSINCLIKESKALGKTIALYLKGYSFNERGIPIITGEGIEFTVPNEINIDKIDEIDEMIEIKLKVDNVCENKMISIYFDDKKAACSKEKIIFPNEIKSIVVPKNIINNEINKILIKIE